MRIIAGSKRGMKLFSPKTQDSRPVTDRVKESLFSVLYKYDLPNGAIVADLFSGVGSLGLEALSRKARFVTFVEQDPKIISVLKRNIEKADFVNESEIIRANAFKFGGSPDPDRQMYDLVFVDPPYAASMDVQAGSHLSGLLDSLGTRVTENAVIVVRTDRKVSLLEQYGELRIIDRRRWGTMAVTILQKTNE
ncbi:MAG: 16S rRNA (guanine(966)-N(2))-methyltransferase RsmD [Planctomycetes bacterium]|nr:16S rRNA (guanine(966)-N(2))-methyltransferase RsmD [Planctomycetota bacterium]MBL7144638.1 16S rRNA (guanine(966)-N(2))-methyltransferase RsmD [Phycisphaerae bacterium]